MLKKNIITFIGVITIVLIVKIFVFDYYTIMSYSMYPTLIKGDHICINRIFKNLVNKSRRIKYNDIILFICFNNQNIKHNSVLVKRCIGLPGDTIEISNGFFKNNNYKNILGILEEQRRLSENEQYKILDNKVYPNDTTIFKWTLYNWGPLFIPNKFSKIQINEKTTLLYKSCIEYETNKKLTIGKDKKTYLNGQKITSYTFDKNYYFMCGDNVTRSQDSRNWGLIPEDFIIGIPKYIIYSQNQNSSKVLKNRILKKIQ